MERTSAIVVLTAILAAIFLSFAAYGTPTKLADAAQHATIVGALLLPASLLLLVRSLDFAGSQHGADAAGKFPGFAGACPDHAH